jgi:arylsulfatase A-like enzyme
MLNCLMSQREIRTTHIAVSVIVLAAAFCCGPVSAASSLPNVVLIVADDLGYGDLGCYGQQRIRTPHIDRLAAHGTRFTQFYAGSTVCAPSRCVLMTGLHAGHCYIRGNAALDLRPSDVTVAEVFRGAGYETGLFGKWGLGHEGSAGVPTRQGFEQFFGYLDQHHAHNYYPSFLMRNEERVALRNAVPGSGPFGGGVAAEKIDYSPDLIADEALAFIDRQHQRPFFLYFAPTLPHANNEAGSRGMEIPDYGDYADEDWPDPEKGRAAMISRLDRDVGRIMSRLKRHDLVDQTLVIFTSDNGPHAEGGSDPGFFDSNGPLRGKKRDLYEGGIRVPFIVTWPGTTPASAVSDHIGYFADMLPTAAELTGQSLSVDTDGLSLVPTIRGRNDEQPKHKFLYWEFYERGSAQAIRLGDWKAVVQPLGGNNVELYHLSNDLAEQHNVAADNPAVVAQLLGFIRGAHVPSDLWRVKAKAPKK